MRRCPYCGGVYDAMDLSETDADGEPNEPCACGMFEAEPEEIEQHELATDPEEDDPEERCEVCGSMWLQDSLQGGCCPACRTGFEDPML